MHKIWETLEKEAKDIIDEYYAKQDKNFLEQMKLSEYDLNVEDPFSAYEIYQGPDLDPNLQGIDPAQNLDPAYEGAMESFIDTNQTPFDNMLVGDEDE